ncbi:RNA-DNA hybrid ribonuclease [Mortierella claussenii]|nr:RNA-DNA hybrid ribonuclease [Mortierella claussenii]
MDLSPASVTDAADTALRVSNSSDSSSSSASIGENTLGARPIITLPTPLWSSTIASSSTATASSSSTSGQTGQTGQTGPALQLQGSTAPSPQDEQAVEQYKDDLALHTQLQLQLYLEDLEEAEVQAQQVEAQQVEAALAASLHPDQALNPLHDSPLLPFAVAAETLDSSASEEAPAGEVTTQFFQEQMLSLEYIALAAAAVPPQPFTPGQDISSTDDGLGQQRGHGHGEGVLDLQDEMDDDDEECLPPSETKYILYDDHVSPISVADALILLNGSLLEDLPEGEGPAVAGEDEDRCRSNFHSHHDHDGDSPVYGSFSSSSITTTTTTATTETATTMTKSSLPPLSKTHMDQSGERGDYIQLLEEERGHGFEEMPHGMKGGSACLGKDIHGHDDTRLQQQQDEYDDESIHADVLGLLSTPPGSKSESSERGDLEEEQLQGRPSHQGGPDVLLNLAGNMMSPITVHDLFFSRYYSRIVYLNLWDTNLGIWGAQAVGGLMADRACRVQYLNLGRNRLGFEGIVQLSGLYKNSSLVELDLSENHLGPKAVHSLQQIMVRLKKDKSCKIRHLNLCNNEINDVGCISIAKIILGTILTHLNLSFNKISDWGASTILAAFESNDLSLRDINLEANPLSFAGGVDICKILVLPNSRITHLDLRGAKVTDVGVPYLAEALKSHQCLIVSLNLYDCQLTDGGILKLAIKLSVNKSLRVLGLGCNCIGDMGILALSQGLCLNSHLEELDLSENDVALSRAGLEALISAMRTNTSLLDLRLDVDGHPHDGLSGSVGGGLYPELFQDNHRRADRQHPVLSSRQGHHYQHQYQLQHQQQHQLQDPQQPRTHASVPGGDNDGMGGQELSPIIENTSEALANINPLEFMVPTEAQVGEVLAPTHASLAQPLQLPLFSPPIPVPVLQAQLHPPHPHLHLPPQQGDGFFTHGTVGVANEFHMMNERNLEQERQQLEQALVTLKTYVRHNYKRTTRLHKLCFEMLVMARVLMFAKDVSMFELSTMTTPSQPSSSPPILSARLEDHLIEGENARGLGTRSSSGPGSEPEPEPESESELESGSGSESGSSSESRLYQTSPSAVIPVQIGLPTPPLGQETESNLKLKTGLALPSKTEALGEGIDDYRDVGQTEVEAISPPLQRQMSFQPIYSFEVSSPSPRGTLAGIPWEIKEMILRGVDFEGLLSERQFQAIVTYAGSHWETVRQPWERWGEIRETILEKTRCYYYEP